MQDKLKEFVKANRDAFDTKEPASDIWNKIRPQVIPVERPETKNKGFYWMRIAAAILCVGAIGVAVFLNNQEDTNRTLLTAEISAEKTVAPPKKAEHSDSIQTPRMVRDISVNNPKKIMNVAFADEPMQKRSTIELLQDSLSSSNRLEAVLAIGRKTIDAHELALLEKVALSDPNTNVRMAAAELWLEQQSEASRSEKIQRLFVAQHDPTMQAELLQEMTADQDGRINEQTIEKLNEIVEDPFALSFLKEQAYAVLLEQYN